MIGLGAMPSIGASESTHCRTSLRSGALLGVLRAFPYAASLLLPKPLLAEPVAKSSKLENESIEVVVQGKPAPPGIRASPLSRTVVDSELVVRHGGAAPTEALVAVPGVLVQNRENQAQDVRLDVRGFGTRAAFGMRGVRILLDGLPVTLPDGQTSLDSMALSNLEHIEVIRGPASVLYGSTPGGAILLSTGEASTSPRFRLRMRVGAFGTAEIRSRSEGRLQFPSGAYLGYRLSTTSFTTDGYRDHASAKTEAMHVRLDLVTRETLRLMLVTDLSHSPWLEDPGGLLASEFHGNPRQAAPNSLRFDTGESVRQLRSGLVLRSKPSLRDEIVASVFLNARDFTASRPERLISFARTHEGGMLSATTTRPLLGLPNRFAIGLQVEQQHDRRQNLTNDGGARALLLHQGERVLSIGASLHDTVTPIDHVNLLAGIRYQRSRYELVDHQVSDGDQSGALVFTSISSLGGVSLDLPDAVWFANLGRSYENPTLTELTNRPEEQSGLNRELRPVSATSLETGLRWEPVSGLRPELALFRIELRDELVPYEDETQRVYYRNSGRSHRQGVEGTIGIARGALMVRSTYTYVDARFDGYQSAGIDHGNHRVPGIPPHRWANVVRYGRDEGVVLGADIVWYDRTFVNDANDERSLGQLTTAILGGYRFPWGPWSIALEARAQNLLDRNQPDNLRVNASGRRYYEPAPGFGLFGGIEVTHAFRRVVAH